MRLSSNNGGRISSGKSGTSHETVFAVVLCVFLVVFLAWGLRESRKAIRGLGLWSVLMEQARRIEKYLCLFALLLLLARAFKGIWGAVKMLFIILFWIPMLLAEGLWNLLARKNAEVSSNDAELCREQKIPLFGRIVFRLVEIRNREHLIGDLEEEYLTCVLQICGYFRARCWWWRQVLGIVWPYVRRRLARVLGLEMLMGLRRR